MTRENDLILSKLTVRLKHFNTSIVIGSGILYYNYNLRDKVYILTAAHNLYNDPESFNEPINKIDIDIYNSSTNSYQQIAYTIKYDLVFPDSNKDIAVLLLNRNDIEAITGEIPAIGAIRDRLSAKNFILKGFPNATKGEELACLKPVWLQKMTGVEKFQLELIEDYRDWAIGGFSGSGIFLNANNQLYLYGIFTRYRPEEKGKVIYFQYIETVNEILAKNYLPLISFLFFGEHGLTKNFFNKHIDAAIDNLGPRYNAKINFKLPIALWFNDLAKDKIFKQRLLKTIDNWLLAHSYSLVKEDHKFIGEVETDFRNIKKTVFDWLSTLSWEPGQYIDLTDIRSGIDALNSKVENKRTLLNDMRREDEKVNHDKKKDYNYHSPYESEINRLREIYQNNYDFLNELNNINVSLSNHPFLIIQGEAGCGKSHLLGDIANERKKNNQPTLLLLGQLFRSSRNVWQNILDQLNLSCSKEEFLISLNSIGQQINSRVLILIDALNEGSGKELWPNELAGFISDLSDYPFIGVALTIRNTYYDTIIPFSVREDKNICHETHEGFKGNEYEALSLFCDHFGLQQPDFPILAPEFTNPLFLQLICTGVKNDGQIKFPQGFQGVSEIFGFYLKAIYDKLTNKREEYELRKHIVKNALNEMAKACFEEENTRTLPLVKAVELFTYKFPEHRNLLNDLILENVFIQSICRDYKTGANIEVLYFAYERFGDFYMAKELLNQFIDSEQLKKAFQKDNDLGKLIENYYGRNKGILEAMAILLPENWNLEIVEVYNWVFENEEENKFDNIGDWLNHFLIDSLKWRSLQSIDNEKLTKWVNSDKFNIDHQSYYNALIELTTQINHPFNGDRLFRILMQDTMPERDAYLQRFFLYYSMKDDDGKAYPIKRLIDWAWKADISSRIDSETARLTGQTLAWILSTTNRGLRDRTTKAMVNLLEEQPDALINILIAFKDIDDYYILERLYGIAYGCALRTTKDESVQKIAQYVYNIIFKNGNPPKHILLRDYAINTVEYAIYKELTIEGDTSLIKPPFKSKMPTIIPTKEQIETYEMDREAPTYKQNYGVYHNQIIISVMMWDFGKYVVESAFRDFCPFSFTMENEYKVFLKSLNKKQREDIKLIESYSKLITLYKKEKGKLITLLGTDEYNNSIVSMEHYLTTFNSNLKQLLKEEEYSFLTSKIIPHINAKQNSKEWQRDYLHIDSVKCMIVQRSFELGYKEDWHGAYDSSIENYNYQSEIRIERIGKKYQWIALHEIIAMFADNYTVKKDDWSDKSKYIYYPGAWHGYLRDVDPAFITKSNDKDIELDCEFEISIAKSKWWLDVQYTYWNTSDSIWISTIKDLPDPKLIILSKDESGHEWLYLKTYIDWDEPKSVGEDKYNISRKNIYYGIHCFIIHKKEHPKILKWLQQNNFGRSWHPESRNANLSLFNRENYWSQASKENEKENWEYIPNTRFKVINTTVPAVGELSKDKSGAHFCYEMPGKMIFEGMKLKYSKNDGEFKNEDGEIVVINPENQGILIRKDYFLQFLNENNLDIIWKLYGEKQALKGTFANGTNLIKVINGVYSMENNEVRGSLISTNLE